VPARPSPSLPRLGRLLPLAAIVVLTGCGLFSSVDTDRLERDIHMRLIVQSQVPGAIPSTPQSSTPPAISVSCPSDPPTSRGRASALGECYPSELGPTTPSTPGTPGLSTSSAQTQRYEVNVRVVDGSGAVRRTARPVD
jgi:hypothetical protein